MSAIKAPHQDLTLLQNLIKYRDINAEVSEAALSKLSGHLWYLSEDCAALSLFDDTVSSEIKVKIAHAIKERKGADLVLKRIKIVNADYDTWISKDVSDFVTRNSLFLFNQYNLPYDFLDVSPDSWQIHPSYIKCIKVFKDLKVCNDTAERAVALVEDYNLLLTKDEDQRQFLLQAVKFHHKMYPGCRKKDLLLI